MQIIDLEGKPYNRGYEQGWRARGQFEKMLEEFFGSELWKENGPANVPRLFVRLGLGLAGSVMTRGLVKKYLPLQHERINGIADGLNVNRAFGWGIQFLEVMFCAAGKSLQAPDVPGGCTQVHATPAATAAGRPLMGRNYDFPNLLLPYQLVRRDVPDAPDRLATTTVCQIALLGAHQGVNEAGLAVAANNARLWKGEDLKLKGIPYQMLLLEILETCRTTAEAVRFITEFPARANSGFFGIMDEKGDCALVEFTASRSMVRRPDDSGVLAQSNHYHAMKDANLPDGTFWTVQGMEGLEYATSTKARFNAADRLLREAAGGITVDTLKSILRDHSANNGAGSDCTVCCHGDSGSTLASMIIEPDSRTLWIAEGTPCTAEYVKVPFRTRASAAAAEEEKKKEEAIVAG